MYTAAVEPPKIQQEHRSKCETKQSQGKYQYHNNNMKNNQEEKKKENAIQHYIHIYIMLKRHTRSPRTPYLPSCCTARAVLLLDLYTAVRPDQMKAAWSPCIYSSTGCKRNWQLASRTLPRSSRLWYYNKAYIIYSVFCTTTVFCSSRALRARCATQVVPIYSTQRRSKKNWF